MCEKKCDSCTIETIEKEIERCGFTNSCDQPLEGHRGYIALVKRAKELRTDKSNLEADILKFNDICFNKTQKLRAENKVLEDQVTMLNKVIEDLNGRIVELNKTVEYWKNVASFPA